MSKTLIKRVELDHETPATDWLWTYNNERPNMGMAG